MSILSADFNGVPWQGSLVDAVAVVLPMLGEVSRRVAGEPTCCCCCYCLNPQHFAAEIVGFPGLTIRKLWFCRWKLSTLALLHGYSQLTGVLGRDILQLLPRRLSFSLSQVPACLEGKLLTFGDGPSNVPSMPAR